MLSTTPLLWFIPSVHGDIRLETVGPKQTKLIAADLTPLEEKAMEALREKATAPALGKPWADRTAFLPLTSSAYRTPKGVEVLLAAPLDKVQKVLAKLLKPGRELVHAVRFTSGRIEETSSSTALARVAHEDKAEEKAAAAAKDKPKAGASVSQPVNGCPMPDFPAADVRASRVLETFLEPDQVDDYRRRGAFITTGADTGRRYLVANREQPALMRAQMGGRQLFDLDLGHPICVHDWAVPPPEEMLALHLCLTLPGREAKLLMLPELDHEIAMLDVDPAFRPRHFP